MALVSTFELRHSSLIRGFELRHSSFHTRIRAFTRGFERRPRRAGIFDIRNIGASYGRVHLPASLPDPVQGARLPQQFTDVLVIGGGRRGPAGGHRGRRRGADVLVLTKDTIEQSNTWYAQGGIAAVLQPAGQLSSRTSHDTEKGGAGLCDHEAVEVVIKEGPQRVLELLEWGANFDKKPGNAHGLAFTREGGHSLRPHPPRLRRRHRQGTGPDADPHRPRPRGDPRLREQLRHRPGDRRGPVPRRAGADQRAGQAHLGQAHDPRQRRGGAALPRIDQPQDRHRRRPRDGVPRRGDAAGHGDGAVPPDDALRRRREPGADHRGGPRRRGVPGGPQRPPVHAGLSRDGRAGAARRGEPGDRRADPQDAFHARLPRRAAPAATGVPRAVPATGQADRSSSRSTLPRT